MPVKPLPPEKAPLRDQWSRLGFFLAAIGSAVGIGNIWRFPYMVGINGGGAFLIPYLIGVLVFSLPLMILELESGRQFRGSVITVLKRINPKTRIIGILPIFISLGVAGYYFVITGWSFAYFLFSFSGYMPFAEFTGSLYPLLFFMITLAITTFVISKGIKKGIEKLALILMPMFAGLLVILAIYSLTLPGAGEGLSFYLTPDFSVLGNPTVWVFGFVQAFFSLAVGYGILLTYASYLGKKEDVKRYALGIAGADTGIALIGGLLVFPIVFTYGLDPASGSGLTFLSLPLVFSSIPLGFLVGAAFFLLLFVAGLTSAVSFVEVGASSLIDEKRYSRIKATAIASIIVAIVGIPASLTFFGTGLSIGGLPLIEWLDMFFGELLLVSAALVTFAIMSRFTPGFLSKKGLPRVGLYMLKYAIPIVLLVVFLFNLLF